jgi:tetratricopeptide (TPR) repeat protein
MRRFSIAGNHVVPKECEPMRFWSLLLRSRIIAPAMAACALLAASPAPAGSTSSGSGGDLAVDHAKEYADCMTLARRVPEQALEAAHAWQAQNGGIPAGHCAAVALIGLSRFPQAADAMEKLAADQAKTRKDLAADLYAQAGQAWVLANDNQHAIKAETAALALVPDDPDLLTDRGVTLASTGKYWEAIDDFNKAHDLARDRADILVLRATAYRLLKSYDLAREDIDQALQLKPKNPDAYLERGIIRQLSNDPAGAKADWQKTVTLGPGTQAAETADANLKQLEQLQPQAQPKPRPQSPAPAQPSAPQP